MAFRMSPGAAQAIEELVCPHLGYVAGSSNKLSATPDVQVLRGTELHSYT